MKAQRPIHATRGQEWVAKCANKPLGHGKRMNNKQAMDTYGSGACTRLRHHQLVPNQYRRGGSWVRDKKMYGLEVGRREKPILGSRLNSFEGNVLLGWHTTQKRERWVGITKCMPWVMVKENTHPYLDEYAMVSKKTKWDSFVWEWDVARLV